MRSSLPSTVGNRLDGLDLARYFAFFGMVIVNFKVVMGAEGSGDLLSLITGSIEGRAAATFVVLAGIGLGLSGVKSINETISVTIRRAVFLLVLGLLNTLVFDADILHYYAFYFFFGALLLSFSNRFLITGILALNIIFVILTLVLDYDSGWNWNEFSYIDFWTPLGFIRNLFFNGWHPVIPWLGFLLFGIVLSRLPLAERSMQWKLIIGGLLSITVAELLSTVVSPALKSIDAELLFFASIQPVPPMPLYSLAGIGTASTVIGFCLLISKWAEQRGISGFLLPAGRQTLTLYIAHIIIGMGILEELEMLGGQTVTTAVMSAILFCVFATVYAIFWSKLFKRGPIEALMRKLTG
ncbi:MAG: DUF418 domain-containing protein [Alphaproteobacteria bacterium]